MKNPLLIHDTSALLVEEVSKVDSLSKVDSFNIRGVGTIFDTCLNLGHLFPFKLNICTVIRTEIYFPRCMPFKYGTTYRYLLEPILSVFGGTTGPAGVEGEGRAASFELPSPSEH
jgi:hypothetical protein